MRMNIFLVVALIALPVVSYAQIDTLMLVEIGSIQASSEITELYVEDLDGDSLKEIILCTDYFVYIYNSQTYQVEWTSPPLIAPTDLLFEDINGDGLIDLSVKDNANIHLFDPHTPGTIWTSPPLDSTYKCYTIGDRNDDDWVDVAIVGKEWFSPDSSDIDTVFISLFNGPDFTSQNTFIILMENWAHDNGPYDRDSTYKEFPYNIIISDLSNNSLLRQSIILSSKIAISWSGWYNLGGSTSGRTWVIDCIDNSIIYTEKMGMNYKTKVKYLNDNRYLYLLSYVSGWAAPEYAWTRSLTYRSQIFSANALIDSSVLWYDSWNYPPTNPQRLWREAIFDEIVNSNNDLEICFGTDDSLYFRSFSNSSIWQTGNISNLETVIGVVSIENQYINPQIVCRIGNPITEHRFFDATSGLLTAVLPQYFLVISNLEDINNDGNNEILSIQGSALYIYDLDYATGVGDEAKLPHRAFLHPNYPNPFNSSTTIEYGLPEAGHATVEIYDLLGRRVETLVDEERQAGRHQVVWDADRYASGLYFYRIEAGDYSDTKRMVYLK